MLLSNKPLTNMSGPISVGTPFSNLEIGANGPSLQRTAQCGMTHSQALITLEQAETLLQQNCVSQALVLLERATQLDPALQRANYARAVCLDRLGRLDEAENAIRAELSLYPNHVQARRLFHELRIKRRQTANPVPSAQVPRVNTPASSGEPQSPEEELEKLCQERQQWLRQCDTNHNADPSLYNRPGSLLGLRHEQIFSQLTERGIVKIPNAIEPVTLTYMKGEFAWFIDRLDRNPVPPHKDGFSEEYFSPEFYNYHTNNPFKYSTAFLRQCVHPEILALVNRYFGRQVSLVYACATRSLAKDIGRVGSYQWHHDAWGRRVHLMILLTDVGEEDQYMTFAEGTHSLFHPYQRFVHSRIHQNEFDTYSGHAPVFKATGNAGDVFLFDSNGLHSGNRTNGHVRDIYLACYSPDPTSVWGLDIPQRSLETLCAEQQKPLQRMRDRWLANQGRFGFPEHLSFVAGLKNVDGWRV